MAAKLSIYFGCFDGCASEAFRPSEPSKLTLTIITINLKNLILRQSIYESKYHQVKRDN